MVKVFEQNAFPKIEFPLPKFIFAQRYRFPHNMCVYVAKSR